MRSTGKFILDITEKIKSDKSTSEQLTLELTWFLDDVFKVVKNINETSLNDSDRFKRIIELEEKYGIPKTHLI